MLALQLHHLLLQLLDVGGLISQILDVLLYNILILGLQQLLLLLGKCSRSCKSRALAGLCLSVYL